MELHNVQVKSVGSDVKNNPGAVTPNPVAMYDSSEGVPFNDRAVLDFGNLTVSVNTWYRSTYIHQVLER